MKPFLKYTITKFFTVYIFIHVNRNKHMVFYSCVDTFIHTYWKKKRPPIMGKRLKKN